MNTSSMESLKLLIIVCFLIAPSLANYARPLFPTGSLSPEENKERIKTCGKELKSNGVKLNFNASYISDRHILADTDLIKEKYDPKVCRDNSKNVLSMVDLWFPRISKATLIGECNEKEPSGVILMETSSHIVHGYECLDGSKNPGNSNSYINSIHLTDNQKEQICVASGICEKAAIRHDRESDEPKTLNDWLSRRMDVSMLPTENPMSDQHQMDHSEDEPKAFTPGQAMKDFFYSHYGTLMDQIWGVETTTCMTVEPTYVPAPVFTDEAPVPPTYVPAPVEEVETTTCLTVEPTYVPAPIFTKEAPIPPTYVPFPEEGVETTTCLTVEPTYVPAPIFTEGPDDGPIPPTYVPAPVFTKDPPVPPTYVHVPDGEVETTTCLTVEPTYVPAPVFTREPPIPPTYVPAPIFTKEAPIPPTYVPVPEDGIETTTCLTVEPTYVPAPVFTEGPDDGSIPPTYIPAPIFTKEPPIPPSYVTVPDGLSTKPEYTDYPGQIPVESTAEPTYMPAPVFTKESPVPPIYVTAPIFTKKVTTENSENSFTTPSPFDLLQTTTVEDSVRKSTKNLWDILSVKPNTDSMPLSTEVSESSTLVNPVELVTEDSEKSTVFIETTGNVEPTTEDLWRTTNYDTTAVTVESVTPTSFELGTTKRPNDATTEKPTDFDPTTDSGEGATIFISGRFETTTDENFGRTEDSEVTTMEVEASTEESGTTESSGTESATEDTGSTTPQLEMSSEGTTENSGNVIVQGGSEITTEAVESTTIGILSSEKPTTAVEEDTTVIVEYPESTESPISTTSSVPEQVSGETTELTVEPEETSTAESINPEATTYIVEESSTPSEEESSSGFGNTKGSTTSEEPINKSTDFSELSTSSEEGPTKTPTSGTEESITSSEAGEKTTTEESGTVRPEIPATTTEELTTTTTTTTPGTTEDPCGGVHICMGEEPWRRR